MNLPRLQRVERPEHYIQRAFNATRKSKKSKSRIVLQREKDQTLQKIRLFKDKIQEDLHNLFTSFPTLSDLALFYQELVRIMIGEPELKQALSRLKGISLRMNPIFKDYSYRIKTSRNLEHILKLKREMEGRLISLLKRGRPAFLFLEASRRKYVEFPRLKTKMPTVCITGFPNVGKTTLLKNLSGARVVIRPYPFTTQELKVGYLEEDWQVLDTPGTLNRFNKMNSMEQQAYLAMDLLGNTIIYVFDLSETCGYPFKNQLRLFKRLRKWFKNKRWIIFWAKKDLLNEDQIAMFSRMFQDISSYSEVTELKSFLQRK